ncbi:MAG TPA: hypothetical protein VLH56_11885 [Dissulfurispiraceae bacterium]|nr:hypothetical protein [Dissulfurispiraceae bacterium]
MTMKWRENSEMASKICEPRAVFDGRLFGGTRENIIENTGGLIVWDGQTYRTGASLNNTHVLAWAWGVPNVGIFLGSSSGGDFFLNKTPDGIQDFTQVATVGALTPRGLIDCGRMMIDGVEQRLLLFAEHVNAPRLFQGRVWYSVAANDADAGNAWVDLFGQCTGINHFHGGVFIAGKGLYLFTGDLGVVDAPHRHDSVLFASSETHTGTASAAHATILTVATARFATNVLIGNRIRNVTTGATGIITANTTTTITVTVLTGGSRQDWAVNDVYFVESTLASLIRLASEFRDVRWRLMAGQRDVWGTTVQRSPYILEGNTFRMRVLDLVTSDDKSAYFIPDQRPPVGGNSIYKVDLWNTTDSLGGTISTIKEGGVIGVGWNGIAGSNGIVYFQTATFPNDTRTGMQPGNDEYIRLYAIDPETDEVADVKQVRRADFNRETGTFLTASPGGLNIVDMIEYGGEIWLNTPKHFFNRNITGMLKLSSDTYCGRVEKQRRPQPNLLTNADFANGLAGWSINIHQLTFTSGVSQIVAGNTVTGKTSGATAVVTSVTVSSGSWGGGDAVGHLGLSASAGNFQWGEILTVGGIDRAALNGGVTWEVIDDPTGEGGRALKCHFRKSGITHAGAAADIRPIISAATQARIVGGMATYSCRFYIVPGASERLSIQLDFISNSLIRIPSTQPVHVPPSFGIQVDTPRGVWHPLSVSSLVPQHQALGWMFNLMFIPHLSKTDGKSGTIYMRDFELVQGAIPNRHIETMAVGGRLKNRYLA